MIKYNNNTIKTIDINVKEWFDKTYGNSYFAGTVTINFGFLDQKTFKMPFQYGYGSHYIDMAGELLEKNNVIHLSKHQALWAFCKDHNIILRTYKQENCLKRELLNI